MDRWWTEIEAAVRDALHERDELSVTDVAARLGVSESAAASLLGVLAADGRIRIVTVAGPAGR
jgi:predicted ArsR family transcriptional regulator